MDTGGDTFFCELRADRRSLCRNFDRGNGRGDSTGKLRLRDRVGGTIFLYRETIVNELSSPEEVFASRIRHCEDSFLGFTIYIAAPNPIMFRRKLRATNQKLTAKSARDRSEIELQSTRRVTFAPPFGYCTSLSDVLRLFQRHSVRRLIGADVMRDEAIN